MLLNFDLAQIAEDYMLGLVTHVGKALKMETEKGQIKKTLFWDTAKIWRKKKVRDKMVWKKYSKEEVLNKNVIF